MSYLFSKLFFWLLATFLFGVVMGLLWPSKRGSRL